MCNRTPGPPPFSSMNSMPLLDPRPTSSQAKWSKVVQKQPARILLDVFLTEKSNQIDCYWNTSACGLRMRANCLRRALCKRGRPAHSPICRSASAPRKTVKWKHIRKNTFHKGISCRARFHAHSDALFLQTLRVCIFDHERTI